MTTDARFARERQAMVDEQLRGRGIRDASVLKVMERVPRHLFVPNEYLGEAYADRPLPLGPSGSTISQPYIVALMLEAARLKQTDKVLEIGTGSGYETAILAELVSRVFTIEIEASLTERARLVSQKLGTKNVSFRTGDGYRGWPEETPFDAIIVTAAAEHIPRELVKQLAVGGRLVLPLGEDEQTLVYILKTPHGLESEDLGSVRFVPMRETKKQE